MAASPNEGYAFLIGRLAASSPIHLSTLEFLVTRFRSAFVASIGILAFICTGGAASAQTACGTPGGPDVIVGDITGPQNYSVQNGREALALGTTSCNQGDVWLNWISSTNQHPVIGGELYRFKIVNGAGRFEQIGLSWLKHGFFALSDGLCCTGCQSTDGTHLGVRCSDPYSAPRNGSQSGLGPRYQVNANTGFFNYPPHHTPSGGNTGRVEVEIADLEQTSTNPTTKYFANCQYVTPDDAAAGNQNNNSSSRGVTVSGSGTSWTFGFTSGATQREVPAIKRWAECESGVTLQDIQLPGEGLLILGYKTTNLGGGQYHYEYALYNMNSDKSIRGFTVPIGPGVVLSNVGFRDITYRGNDGIGGGQNFDGTDWAFVNNGTSASWTTSTFASDQNANALRWGTCYSFRFDANAPPNTGLITLDTFKVVGTHQVTADMPGTPPPPVDSDGDGVFDHLDNCPAVSNANQANADGDATGDACDPCTDTDGDGFGNPGFPNNSCATDNCPTTSNANQADFDGDTMGDACDPDDDNDGTSDASDGCDFDPNKTSPGQCGCGVPDTDGDGDGTANCNDGCPTDPNKTAPGVCGCNVSDADSDSDGTPNCNDGCPNDPSKTSPGACGCGVSDVDLDGDFVMDCDDNCPGVYNPDQEDCDNDGIGDFCAIAGGAQDCNLNGLPDSCDIALGTSLDTNLNGVPDECQSGAVTFCFGNGGSVNCPCGNNGPAGRGCRNSNPGSTGAILQASGSTVPDTMILTASGERPTSLTIFLQGDAMQGRTPYGDGLRCVTGTLKRIWTEDAVGGTASYPSLGDLSISARSAALGDPIAPGDTRVYMSYYRDGSATFCPMPTGSSFNATQAILLVW
jgi:hypothetical protein